MFKIIMSNIFNVLTKYSKIIFFLGLFLGTLGAYLERVDFHPYMEYTVDISLVLCAIGLMFWPRK